MKCKTAYEYIYIKKHKYTLRTLCKYTPFMQKNL